MTNGTAIWQLRRKASNGFCDRAELNANNANAKANRAKTASYKYNSLTRFHFK